LLLGKCIAKPRTTWQIDVVLVLDSEGLHASLCKMWAAQGVIWSDQVDGMGEM